MGSEAEIVQIIVLALVAGFIALRLRSVLGQRSDDQHPPTQGTPAQKGAAPAGDDEVGMAPPFVMGTREEGAIKDLSASDRQDLKRIFKPIGGHDLSRFLDGARRAYEETLKGFWSGDMGKMAPFLDRDVASHFKSAIDDRNSRGETTENRLLEISDVSIDDINLVGPNAEVTVRFSSEIIAVVKDKAGRLIEGDVSDTINVTDLWTFARNLKDKDPNWTLVATQGG